MSKTLLVHFAPREGSHTKTLVDYFKTQVGDKTEITEVDLVVNQPSLLPLTDEGMSFAQLKEADYIVIAHPIWNFDAPAAIKAWMDQAWIPGQAFTFGPNGPEPQLTDGKKVLQISVAGGTSSHDVRNHSSKMMEANLELIGITDYQEVFLTGLSRTEPGPEKIVEDGKKQILEVANTWYQ